MANHMMRIVIPGGTGQMGQMLARNFVAQGHQVSVLSRGPSSEPWESIYWDGETIGPWTEALEGADVCINLAGRSVNCRWTKKNRAALLNSRIRSTEILGEVISQLAQPPKLWMNASAANIYQQSIEEPVDESSGIVGTEIDGAPKSWQFSMQLSVDWERAFLKTPTPRTRKVALRTSLLFGAHPGSVFSVMLNLVRMRLGGAVGNGRQYVAWIHERDYARAVEFLIAHEEIECPVNMAAPEPLPNREFMRALRVAWGNGLAVNGLPAPAPLLELGAFFLRTESELVLKSRHVVPGRLLEAGFQFEFNDWQSAADDLVREWRKRND
jgi:uncharacterized protein (TIGR01777 family)